MKRATNETASLQPTAKGVGDAYDLSEDAPKVDQGDRT